MRTAVFSLLFLCFMVFHADLVTKGAAAGLLLWYSSVVPALFPFMVLSSVLPSSGGMQTLMRPFAALFCFAGISADGWYVILAGLLCGCPMGAKSCADLLSEKKIRPEEARFLFAVCNHASPMFLAGFVYPPFAPYLPLSYFVLAVYLPVFLLAVFAHKIYLGGKHSGRKERVPADVSSPDTSSVLLSLDDAVLNSAEVLVKIGGYLMFYSILIVMIHDASWIPGMLRLFLSGVLEITTGIRCVQTSLPFPSSAIAAAAVFSFGGFSAMSQTNAVIRMHAPFPQKNTAGLSIRQYFFWKLAHSLLTAVIMAGLLKMR